METNIVLAAEFLASLFFVVSLSCLKTVKGSKSSVAFASTGLLIAVVTAFTQDNVEGTVPLSIVIVLGSLVGFIFARAISFESLPQMVAIFNSFGGVSAALATFSSFMNKDVEDDAFDKIIVIVTLVLGTLTFSGSLIAASKLQGWVKKTLSGPFSRTFNIALLVATIVLSVLFYLEDPQVTDDIGLVYLLIITAIAFVIGIIMSLAVGGADSPVLISVLNSLSGWSGAFCGMLTGYNALVIVGILVGSSGIILSQAMAVAMNRPLTAVIFGGKMKVAAKHDYDASQVQIASPKDLVDACLDAKKVLFVPGFGLAQSRGGPIVAEIMKDLQSRGIVVHFCVHPVAGRMPGHMAVILAENSIPYELIFDLDELKGQFETYDVAIAIGCADTINPIAQESKDSNIAGMPICPVHHCKKAYVLKRSKRLDSGYSGEPLTLLVKENCRTVLGDARESLGAIQSKLNDVPKSNVSANTEMTVSVTVEEEEALPELLADHVTVGILKETLENEARVAVDPKAAHSLRKMGFKVVIQSGAGDSAKFTDDLYEAKAAFIANDAQSVIEQADVIIKVNIPTLEEVEMMREGQHVISLVMPQFHKEIINKMNAKKLTVTALEQIPRISRSQKMDVLSSQAKAAGFRGVVEATNVIGRFLNAEVTASGKFPPVKAYVIGAGVAGLASIGLLNSLGAEVYAFDTRPIADEIESLGAKFVKPKIDIDGSGVGGYAKELGEREKAAQREMTLEMCKKCDIVVTTAAVPGKRIELIFEDMVAVMKPGSVIVDLGALSGGNCTLTKPGEVITVGNNNVTIIGYTNLPARMPTQSSQMFGQNIVNLLEEFGKGSKATFYTDELFEQDVVVRNSTLLRNGEQLSHPPIQVSKKPSAPVKDVEIVEKKEAKPMTSATKFTLMVILSAVIFAMALITPKNFILLEMLLVLVLASIVGFFIIWSVPANLHSPLMSLSNGISGIVILGAMSLVGSDVVVANVLAIIAASAATINISGGLTVTYMMFQKIVQ
ncbi:hypothetical protein GEMRC1_013012 [Eukaryota sp. GEM-RC1]